jgi:hypothetical protein
MMVAALQKAMPVAQQARKDKTCPPLQRSYMNIDFSSEH